MLISDFFKWWYTDGLKIRLNIFAKELFKTQDFFSIGLLLKTFFKPFRMIDTGAVRGSLDVKIKAFFDKLISRIIGSSIRLATIIFGVIVLLIKFIYEAIKIILWIFAPALPVICLILFALGVAPVWKK